MRITFSIDTDELAQAAQVEAAAADTHVRANYDAFVAAATEGLTNMLRAAGLPAPPPPPAPEQTAPAGEGQVITAVPPTPPA